MEPTEALHAIETALRLLIREVLGGKEWLSAPGAPEEERLRQKLVEEEKRRDGTAVSQDLLDYTETYQLTALIEKNWERFQPIFQDKRRTQAFFGIIEDVRNSIAHSRTLVPFERDLISGVAGQLRNQIALFRSGRTESTRYYPLIETIRDNFGVEARPREPMMFPARGPRLEVGDVVTFDGTAFNARGRPVQWYLLVGRPIGQAEVAAAIRVAEGDSVSFQYTIRESDVGESFLLSIRIAADSKYHRSMPQIGMSYDDERQFMYSVNPPDEP